MASEAGAPPVGWADYLFTDAKVLGIVGWVGLLLGVVSLSVTIAGFVIAIQQIRKVQTASKASKDAADAMMKALQHQDMIASLNEARSHLRLAKVLLGTNLGAAGAYVDTSCNALTQVHEIRGGQENDEMIAHILNLRAAVKFLQATLDPTPSPTRIRKMHSDIANAATLIDSLIARRKYEMRA